MRKLIFLLLSFVLLCNVVEAQSLSKSFDYYDDNKFEKAWAGFNEAVKSKKDLPAAYYGMALCFLNSQSRYKDYDSAFIYANKSMVQFAAENHDEYYPMKYGITRDSMLYLKRLAEKCFADQVIEKRNLVQCDYFVDHYAESEYVENVIKLRDELAFEDAKSKGKAEALDAFCLKYPKSKYYQQAKDLAEKMVYEAATVTNTYQAYYDYCTKYPQSSYYAKAKDMYELLLYKTFTQEGSLISYERFCSKYPKSPYWPAAQDTIYKWSIRVGDVNSYNQFVLNHPESPYTPAIQDSILKYSVKKFDLAPLERYVVQYPNASNIASVIHSIYEYYAQSGDVTDLQLFESKYPGKEQDQLQKDKQLAQEGLSLLADKKGEQHTQAAYVDFVKRAAPKDIAFFVLQAMVRPMVEAKDWAGALSTIRPLVSSFGRNTQKVDEMVAVLIQSEEGAVLEKLDNVNTSGNEYAPKISVNGSSLFFSANGRTDNLGGDDIFVSKSSGRSWGAASVLPVASSPNTNDILLSEFAGTQLITAQNADIHVTRKTSMGWTLPQSFSENVNTPAWESDAALAISGNALVFASDRKGCVGFNHALDQNYAGTGVGNSDLFVSLKTAQGWSSPINLGQTVNTPFSERSPYLHPDMRTLYFSSNGRGGLGDFDIYKTTRLYDTSWTCWSKPVNVGKVINSANADFIGSVAADGEYLYYAVTNAGQKDIFRAKLPVAVKPSWVFALSGKGFDNAKKPIEAKVYWEDMETGKILGESSTDPADGSFALALPAGKAYGFYLEKENCFPVSQHIDLRNGQSVSSINPTIVLLSFTEMIKNGTPVPLNNVMFNFNDYHLLPMSNVELNRIAELLKRNMTLKIEVSGYSDVATPEGDMLAYQRAAEVGNYLIQHGCRPESIVLAAKASAPTKNATKGKKQVKKPVKKGKKGKTAVDSSPVVVNKTVNIKFLGF
jgi:outer membrane protein OmpA-like peptidoglycan-associated protein